MLEKLTMLGFGVACILIGCALLKCPGKGENTKICPYCRSKIDAKAYMCPYCRSHQRFFSGVSLAKVIMGVTIPAGLGLLVIGVALVAAVFGIFPS